MQMAVSVSICSTISLADLLPKQCFLASKKSPTGDQLTGEFLTISSNLRGDWHFTGRQECLDCLRYKLHLDEGFLLVEVLVLNLGP